MPLLALDCDIASETLDRPSCGFGLQDDRRQDFQNVWFWLRFRLRDFSESAMSFDQTREEPIASPDIRFLELFFVVACINVHFPVPL
jgi:hypothetical protein